MRKSYLQSILGLSLIAASTSAYAGRPLERPSLDEILTRWQNAEAPAMASSLDESHDGMAIITLPDGRYWYYTSDFDYKILSENEWFVDKTPIHFRYDFYDEGLNHVGTVEDDVRYKENELRVPLIALSPIVTKKFFNYDDNYEIILSFAYNTPAYINKNYVRVYSIGGATDEDGNSEMIWELPDFLIADGVNASDNSWTESYYLTFSQEIEDETEPDEFERYRMVLKTYSKATYGEGPALVNDTHIIYSHMPGDTESTPAFMSWAEGGRAYFFIQQYEKRFFQEPYGGSDNEDITPGNHLLADIWSIESGDSQFTHEKSLSVATVPDENFYWTFYGIGNLGARRDVIRNGNDWNFILTKLYYIPASDELIYSYYHIDSEGNVINTIFELAETCVHAKDLRGYPEQYVFAAPNGEMTDDGGIIYDFYAVNVPSGEMVFSVPSQMNGLGLTTNLNRIKTADGYNYAFVTNTPDMLEDGSVLDRIAWFDAEGNLLRVEGINVGKDVSLATLNISDSFFSPYIFNTDAEMEYVYGVKRMAADGGSLVNELLVVRPDGTRLLERVSDSRKELSNYIYVPNDNNTKLQVIYYEPDSDTYSCEFFNLPLSKFDKGGDGSADNPWMISSIAELQQAGSYPSAYYQLANDIDASGFDFYPIEEFSGVLDGNGHTISNLYLLADDSYSGIFSYMTGATVKDITLENVIVELGDNAMVAGVVGGMVNSSDFTNIHIIGLDVTGAPVSFGGIAGNATTGTHIMGSSVTDARIMTEADAIGGIVSSIRTGCTIAGNLFEGVIEGATEIGGIAGVAISGDEVIRDCRVDASLKGKGIIGGIVGNTGRTVIKNCYVKGDIQTTGNEKAWGDEGPCAGGIAGYMSPNYTSDDGVRISGNIVELNSLAGAQPEKPEAYPGQQDTLHRIVGWTRSNEAPDSSNETIAETGLADNYFVVEILSGEERYNNPASTEGAEMQRSDMTRNRLEALGFIFGNDVDAPWNFTEDSELMLYFESEMSGVGNTPITDGIIKMKDGKIYAEGSVIEIFTPAGLRVASALNEIDVTPLGKGIYLVVATDKSGHRSAIKISSSAR